MSLSVFNTIVFALLSVTVAIGFNPSLRHLSPFLLSYIAVSRPCCLSEFDPNRASCREATRRRRRKVLPIPLDIFSGLFWTSGLSL